MEQEEEFVGTGDEANEACVTGGGFDSGKDKFLGEVSLITLQYIFDSHIHSST